MFALLMSVQAQQKVETPLGLPTTITDLYIPGTKVEPIPRKDREGSLVIRVIEIKPAADGFRYDLEVYGLDPGEHILSDYLQREDGTSINGLDHSVQITTQHALDSLPKPEELTIIPPKKIGGYRLLSIIVGILWTIIFLGILFYKKRPPPTEAPPPPPPTLHEKLNTLVNAASDGSLSKNQQAELERLITGHWKQSAPELASLSPSQAIHQLRTHPEASPLILKLEEWLHAPNSSASQADINQLLEPFR